ncbi:hypothetical protein NDU88_001858 [Pleurodeles waltl]|uniref:Uncharacterized protein n=1 Tax=Pleurodeles waltl TaxID=8319 RepID=A0AAV7R8F7_PLEWA|nr:hypothetical protein NDU88_001858 [Pleurodeles waltl]
MVGSWRTREEPRVQLREELRVQLRGDDVEGGEEDLNGEEWVVASVSESCGGSIGMEEWVKALKDDEDLSKLCDYIANPTKTRNPKEVRCEYSK